jgi:pantoate kinase
MERTAVAFAPGHISGYFRRVDGPHPEETGSCGAGIVIDRGVTARVTGSGKTSVELSPPPHPFPCGAKLIEDLLAGLGVTACVETFAAMPAGAGFGMSAAALLSVLTAANAVFDLHLTEVGIARAAHIAEITHNTGLGDAAAAAGGGLAVRTAPGISGVSRRLYPEEIFYAVTFGPIYTPDVIGSAGGVQRANDAFPGSEPSDLSGFLRLSREFDEKSGFITEDVRRVLDACDAAGVPAAMTMLGNGVFAAGEAAGEVLGRFGTAVPFRASRTGPVLLECSYV